MDVDCTPVHASPFTNITVRLRGALPPWLLLVIGLNSPPYQPIICDERSHMFLHDDITRWHEIQTHLPIFIKLRAFGNLWGSVDIVQVISEGKIHQLVAFPNFIAR